MREDGTVQPLQGLYLSRSSLPLKPLHSVLKPSVCVIAQGSKEVLLGDSRYRYDPSHYLLATVELPRISQVLEASNASALQPEVSSLDNWTPANLRSLLHMTFPPLRLGIYAYMCIISP